MNEVLGVNPSRLRSSLSEDQVIEKLLQWVGQNGEG
jgi:hypothetical protein